jgi:hypothetical protein
VVVGTGIASSESTFQQRNNQESTMDKMSAPKKKIARVSPCFLHLKILKRAFLGDMKQWWSRH